MFAVRALVAVSAALCCVPLAYAQPATVAPPATKAPAADDPTQKLQPTLRDDRSAIDAGKQWLDVLDRGNTGPLWDNAAKPLKTSVTRQKWISGIRDMRKPYGKVDSRTAAKFARAHELPDAPSGDYAIIEFESKFRNGKQAVEQVIWMLESDGVWRVTGYYIK